MLVVCHRELHLRLLACLPVLIGVVGLRIRCQHAARPDANWWRRSRDGFRRIASDGISPEVRQRFVAVVQHPSFRDGDDGRPSFPNGCHMQDQVAHAVERDAFAVSQHHLPGAVGQAIRAGGVAGCAWKALLVESFLLVEHEAVAAAPGPVAAEALLDDFRLATERDLVRAHVRQHDADEVVRSENLGQERDERFFDAGPSFDVHAAGIEKDHEYASMRVGRKLVGPRRRRRIDAFALRGRLPHDVLERLDLLRDAVLRDLEIGGGQILDRLAVLRRVGVHPDSLCRP